MLLIPNFELAFKFHQTMGKRNDPRLLITKILRI